MKPARYFADNKKVQEFNGHRCVGNCQGPLAKSSLVFWVGLIYNHIVFFLGPVVLLTVMLLCNKC